uniref:YolD-like protein n=1 Tax=Mesocestoides corti TaxID=53468 RepID=A0A5K3FUB8_MESCO
MTTATDKLELSEEEIADDKMTALRTRALNLALQRRLFVSPASTTKMEDPRYMARSYHSNGAVIEYEWISRVVTTDGYLDEDGSYVSGLFKFVIKLSAANSKVLDLTVEQIFV